MVGRGAVDCKALTKSSADVAEQPCSNFLCSQACDRVEFKGPKTPCLTHNLKTYINVDITPE